MRGAGPGQDSGFTLVEALVSLFIFSLIAAGSTALLIQAAQAQRRVTEAHQALRSLQLTRAMVAADLVQIAPRAPRSGVHSGSAPRFVGGDDAVGLGFVRAAIVGDGRLGPTTSLVYVEYAIDDDRLIRRVRTNLSAPAKPDDDDQVLMEGVRDLRFEFFDGVGWSGQWIAVDGGLPRAVALTGEIVRYGDVRIEVLTTETWP
jgi:general secretion pathway protein J